MNHCTRIVVLLAMSWGCCCAHIHAFTGAQRVAASDTAADWKNDTSICQASYYSNASHLYVTAPQLRTAENVHCLVLSGDGSLLGLCAAAHKCAFSIESGVAHVHAYSVHAGAHGPDWVIHAQWRFVVPTRALHGRPPTAPVRAPAAFDVGILYEFWHGFASDAMQHVADVGGQWLTVEDVIQSDGNFTLNDILARYNATSLNDGFYYHGTPAAAVGAGNNPYYCIYKKRANESTGWIPDCTNITETLTRHALQLISAGVDYVVTDETNLPTWSVEADVIQIRPFEVIFEVWAQLRANGTKTPSLTAWQAIPPGSTNWQNALALYNAYPDLVYRDPVTGKMVFFIPTSNPDPGIIAAIESNGGANDVTVVQMWAEFAEADFSNGLWAFFSPCTALDGNGSPVYTSSVVGLGRGATACQQLMTTNSPLGAALTVSPSLQLSYGSLPFTETNKYDGLTLKRQFATLINLTVAGISNPTVTVPTHVFLSSWNEWIAQPQPNPYSSPYAFSMGLPWDPAKSELWVDTYGCSNSRDLEPSVQYGSVLYDIVASCLRVAHLAAAISQDALQQQTWAAAATASNMSHVGVISAIQHALAADPGTMAACGVLGEVCCQYNDTVDGYAVVWALTLDGGGDALLTGDPNELRHLTCPGCGWTQTCNAYSGPTDFCVDSTIVTSLLALQGPFVLHNGGCGAQADQAINVAGRAAPATSSISLPDRTPLYRCYDGTHHSFNTDPDCGGAKLESTLGCMHAVRTSNMPRALRKCTTSSGGAYHVLDGPCSAGDTDAGVLGFVR